MSRPGDWRCPLCNNHNFKFRTNCNRCHAEKPEDASIEHNRVDFRGKIRPGDWTCCSCYNRNFAFRDVCNRCELPRYVTQTLFSASLLDDEADAHPPGLDLQLRQFQTSSHDSGVSVGPVNVNLMHGKMVHDPIGTPPRSKRMMQKEAPSNPNWHCSRCWNLNNGVQSRCVYCQQPNHQQSVQTSHLGIGSVMGLDNDQKMSTLPTPSPWGAQAVSS